MGEHSAPLTRRESLIEARLARYADALDRAWRTFKQGILIDALGAIGTGVLVLMEKVDPTEPAFWNLVGAIVLRSFAAAAASFLHRLKTEPKA
jgi:hypothetical protein